MAAALQRRLPKFGFTSTQSRYVAEVRLHELSKLDESQVNIESLKKANLFQVTLDMLKSFLQVK